MNSILPCLLVITCGVFTANAYEDDSHNDIDNRYTESAQHGESNGDIANQYRQGYVNGYDVVYPTAPVVAPEPRDAYNDLSTAFHSGWADGYCDAASSNTPSVLIGGNFFPHVGIIIFRSGVINKCTPGFSIVSNCVYYRAARWVAPMKVFPAGAVAIINRRRAIQAVRVLPAQLIRPEVRRRYGSSEKRTQKVGSDAKSVAIRKPSTMSRKQVAAHNNQTLALRPRAPRAAQSVSHSNAHRSSKLNHKSASHYDVSVPTRRGDQSPYVSRQLTFNRQARFYELKSMHRSRVFNPNVHSSVSRPLQLRTTVNRNISLRRNH